MPISDTTKSTAQHAVPQNIMDVEFKLIGNLTMRQFSYLGICAVLAYINFKFVPGIFKLPISFAFAGTGLALAFVPVQERGLDQWIINFIRAVYTPTQRIWKKSVTLPSAFSYANLAMVKQELITLAPTSSRRKLEEFLDYQQNEGPEDPLDIPEEEYIMKVRKAFASPEASANAEPSAPTRDAPVSATPVTPVAPINPAASTAISKEPKKEERAAPSAAKPAEISQPTPVQKLEQVRARAQGSAVIQTTRRPQKSALPSAVPSPAPAPSVVTRRVARSKPAPSGPALDPMTPDMHSGRRFVSFLPAQGELILPIRGERVIKSSEQIESEGDVMEKARQLQEFLAQIRENEPLVVQPSTLSTTVSDAEQLSRDAKRFAENLKSRTDALVKQISTVESEIEAEGKDGASKNKKEVLESLVKQRNEISRQYDTITGQVSDIQSKLHGIPQKKKPAVSTRARAPVLQQVTTPNIPAGFVKDFTGRPVSGLVLLFKNRRGDPVRATKTNAVGRFALTTPLSNGAYTVVASPANNSGLSFDIISFEAKGQPIASLELVGK